MRASSLLTLVGAALMLGGCAGRTLMKAPNVYVSGEKELYGELPADFQRNQVELTYVTDRAPERGEQGELCYGYGRSNSLAFGTTVIMIGKNLSWDEVVSQSLSQNRTRNLTLEVASITELGRFPEQPFPFVLEGDEVKHDPEVVAEANRIAKELRQHLLSRLRLTPRKEVFLYIHGYNNDFDEAAFTLAELWHYLGREGLPIIYSWPAGYGGLKGYAHDRESGEFTIYHLKQFLKFLASLDEVERIHLIAHSRGTDVAITALRELFMVAKASGANPRERFKIANLVLAAPDLDFQVVTQRVVAEAVGPGTRQITIYTSQGDKAISASEVLFDSVARVGRIEQRDFKSEWLELIRQATHIEFVDHQGTGDTFGHGYFHTNPAASSDLIMVLRYDAAPGAEYGRPLQPAGPRFWIITDDYLKPEAN